MWINELAYMPSKQNAAVAFTTAALRVIARAAVPERRWLLVVLEFQAHHRALLHFLAVAHDGFEAPLTHGADG